MMHVRHGRHNLPLLPLTQPRREVGITNMTEQPTDKRERYVGYSAFCLQLAKVVLDNKSRTMLREMASEWLKLAEQSYERD
jgi:hypothetical protein